MLLLTELIIVVNILTKLLCLRTHFHVPFSSLELPYVTPLENKQRKTFPKTIINTGTQNASKPRPAQKQRCECNFCITQGVLCN